VNPTGVLDQLDVKPGEKVADFGCGSGYFSFEFAKRVGAEGQVYAFDVLPSALEAVESRAKTLGIHNLSTKRANLERPEGSTFLQESVDWVVIKDILLQNDDKQAIMNEAARILRPSGRVLVMEWNPDAKLVGPEAKRRLSRGDLDVLIEGAGLRTERELSVGAFHYALILRKV
jgi:ubiquinone/menaquinone biosynthesis C-methylase UbiE